MRSIWWALHRAPRRTRWPIKGAAFAIVLLFVLYPYPRQLADHVRHLRRLNRLPDADDPRLADVRRRFDQYLSERGASPGDVPAVLEAVEAFVTAEVPYGWDWVVWGAADYTPTLSELLTKRTEDSDGRAVLAAALLRRRGIPADLVADPRHMWVHTPWGDTMNPLGPPVFQWTDEGLVIDWRRLLDPGPFAFGVAVFPLRRELILLLTAWLLTLRPAAGRLRPILALLLLGAGLGVCRLAGADPLNPNHAGIALAAGLTLMGLYTTLGEVRRAGRTDGSRFPGADKLIADSPHGIPSAIRNSQSAMPSLTQSASDTQGEVVA